MRQKMQILNSCSECIHRDMHWKHLDRPYCFHTDIYNEATTEGRWIKTGGVIPEWCPLRDVPQNTKEENSNSSPSGPPTQVKSSADATDEHICADYPKVQCCFQVYENKPKCDRPDKECPHIRLLT